MTHLTPDGAIKIMIFLYKMGKIDALTLFQFLQNAAAQYGVGLTISAVGQNIEPSMLIKPVFQPVTTGFNYLTSSGIDPTERVTCIIQVAIFSALSAAATTTDPAVNTGVAGVNVAFLAYMMKILETSNNNNIAFILPFKDGQGKVGLIMVLVTGLGFVLFYVTKSYLKLLKSSYSFGVRSVDKIFKKFSKVQFIPVY